VQHHDEPALPKLLVIGGTSTHLDDGPSHNLHDSQSEISSHLPLETSSLSLSSSQRETGGFWRDVADDIGVPMNFGMQAVPKAVLEAIPKIGGPSQKTYSRPLNTDESNGVWVLFGLLAGTWVVGGLFARRPDTEKHT
jgi:hypothetical protein